MIYDHEIIFVKKGKCVYHIENQEYVLQSGDIHFMHPHVQHSCYVPMGEEFAYFAVHFDLVYMGEELDFSTDDVYVLKYGELDEIPLNEELADRPMMEIGEVEFPYLFHSRNPRNYHPYFRRLLTAYQDKEYGYHMEMRACLLMILKEMIKDIATEEGMDKGHFHREKMIETIQFMHNHYFQQLDFEKLAQSIFISPSYFRVLCKQATGKTPTELLTSIRMEKSKSLLIEGEYSISEISVMVGYPNIHHFSKLFKKMEGLSPKNYRESIPSSRI